MNCYACKQPENGNLRHKVSDCAEALHRALDVANLQNSEFRKALELIRDNTGEDDGEYAIHIATQTVGPLPASEHYTEKRVEESPKKEEPYCAQCDGPCCGADA